MTPTPTDYGRALETMYDYTRGNPRDVANLLTSELYYVTTDMSDLIAQAADSLDDYILRTAHVPVPNGFIWFEHPVPIRVGANPPPSVHFDTDIDFKEAMLHTLAISWAVIEGEFGRGIEVGTWHNHELSHFGIQLYFDEDILSPNAEPRGWTDQVAAAQGDERKHVEFSMSIERGLVKLLGAFFLITGQKLPAINRITDIPRVFSRRIMRANPDAHIELQVVQLRARAARGHDADDGGVDYSHRWIVRGHWHRYWTGPIEGERRLEHRYVAPYVKGPDNKPLIEKRRVFAVVR